LWGKNSLIFWSVFDFAEKEAQLLDLDRQIAEPDFWNDPQAAQRVSKQAAGLRNELDDWRGLQTRASDALELAGLDDDSLRSELEPEIAALEAEMEKRAFAAMLSGPYDAGNAILAIHAGAGGTDAQDWAEMLLRMYVRWGEAQGFDVEQVDMTPGEEVGVKSVTLSMNGRYAFGYLRAEKGVHRLVRLSPFDAAHRRHTSFALIEILPEIENDTAEVQVDPGDLRVDVYRSSSAGGQNVQKNATAIRITHIPTGLVVTCQNERSQLQNRETAMRILRARLYEIRQAKREDEIAVLRGDYTKAEWGSQIRSYVLHPYQMVKDHRTDFEVGNAQSVLDGNLTGLMEAYLRTVGE
jgi:peptide chain release factor 2